MGFADEARARRQQMDADHAVHQVHTRNYWNGLAAILDEFAQALRASGAKPTHQVTVKFFSTKNNGWETHLEGYYRLQVQQNGEWTIVWPAHSADSSSFLLGTRRNGFVGRTGEFDTWPPLDQIRQKLIDYLATVIESAPANRPAVAQSALHSPPMSRPEAKPTAQQPPAAPAEPPGRLGTVELEGYWGTQPADYRNNLGYLVLRTKAPLADGPPLFLFTTHFRAAPKIGECVTAAHAQRYLIGWLPVEATALSQSTGYSVNPTTRGGAASIVGLAEQVGSQFRILTLFNVPV